MQYYLHKEFIFCAITIATQRYGLLLNLLNFAFHMLGSNISHCHQFENKSRSILKLVVNSLASIDFILLNTYLCNIIIPSQSIDHETSIV